MADSLLTATVDGLLSACGPLAVVLLAAVVFLAWALMRERARTARVADRHKDDLLQITREGHAALSALEIPLRELKTLIEAKLK